MNQPPAQKVPFSESQDLFNAPFFYSGSLFKVWTTELFRNWSLVHWRCWLSVPLICLLTALGSGLHWISRLCFSRRIERRPMSGAPLFVLGHWRTGTTLLHELLTLDRRFAYPTLYECTFPQHFLLTETLMTRLTKRFFPIKRSQDDMMVTFSSPGEDEIGLAGLGAGSIYQASMFPSRTQERVAYLDLLELPPAKLDHWKRVFQRHLRELDYRHGKPLVLKSPPHTARVKTLVSIFPEAKFVNIVRDPKVVFSSTLKMWNNLTRMLSLELIGDWNVEDPLIENYRRMHESLREARPLVPAGHFSDVRYEDLVRDPVGQMERIYQELELGGFDEVRPAIKAYFARNRDVRGGRYELTPDQALKVERGLAEVIEETGYAAPGLS